MTHHDGTADAHDDDEKLGGEGTIPAGTTGVAAGHDGGNDHFEPEEDTPHPADEDGDGTAASCSSSGGCERWGG